MAQVIKPTDMNVIIESLIFDFDNKVRETVLELINRIVLTKDERDCGKQSRHMPFVATLTDTSSMASVNTTFG